MGNTEFCNLLSFKNNYGQNVIQDILFIACIFYVFTRNVPESVNECSRAREAGKSERASTHPGRRDGHAREVLASTQAVAAFGHLGKCAPRPAPSLSRFGGIAAGEARWHCARADGTGPPAGGLARRGHGLTSAALRILRAAAHTRLQRARSYVSQLSPALRPQLISSSAVSMSTIPFPVNTERERQPRAWARPLVSPGDTLQDATRSPFPPLTLRLARLLFQLLLIRIKRQLLIQYKYKTESLLTPGLGKNALLHPAYSSFM